MLNVSNLIFLFYHFRFISTHILEKLSFSCSKNGIFVEGRKKNSILHDSFIMFFTYLYCILLNYSWLIVTLSPGYISNRKKSKIILIIVCKNMLTKICWQLEFWFLTFKGVTPSKIMNFSKFQFCHFQVIRSCRIWFLIYFFLLMQSERKNQTNEEEESVRAKISDCKTPANSLVLASIRSFSAQRILMANPNFTNKSFLHEWVRISLCKKVLIAKPLQIHWFWGAPWILPSRQKKLLIPPSCQNRTNRLSRQKNLLFSLCRRKNIAYPAIPPKNIANPVIPHKKTYPAIPQKKDLSRHPANLGNPFLLKFIFFRPKNSDGAPIFNTVQNDLFLIKSAQKFLIVWLFGFN